MSDEQKFWCPECSEHGSVDFLIEHLYEKHHIASCCPNTWEPYPNEVAGRPA